jgi:endonuclease/exonuclease/phosphatase family metal-dependent hydrolase
MVRKFFYFLNILALVVLLLSCMAAYINPNIFWQLSFIGFAFPVVLLVNVFFLILWLFKKSKFAFLPLIAIILSWKFIHASFAYNFTQQTESGLKLMTWNVKNFDLYNWSNNRETRHNMMQLIASEKPDVICLQEYYSNNQFFHNTEYIRDTLGYKYFYFPPAVENTRQPKGKVQTTLWKNGPLIQQWGVATFSKYPITDTGTIRFNNTHTNRCIYTDIKVNDKQVRVYNVHFQSIHLGYDDYAAIDSMEETQQTNWTSVKNILRKMKLAYTRRSLQSNAVSQSMANHTGAELLCGDFNDVPVSYTYQTVKQNLQDAFVEKGSGFGATFVNRFSIFRIDYVLPDKNIKVNSCKTIRKPLSDHYPVCVSLGL